MILKRLIPAFILVCAVSACGGGGSSSGPTLPILGPSPTPMPTVTPAPQGTPKTVASWYGAGHSEGTASKASRRNPFDITSATNEAVEIGGYNSITQDNGTYTGTLQATVATPSGGAAACTAPTVSIADPNVASTNTLPVASPAPSASPVPVSVGTVQGPNGLPLPGATTVTVTCSGTAPASIAVNLYDSIGVESTPTRDAAPAWGLRNGRFIRLTDGSAPDLYVAKDTNGVTTFYAPYGYQVLDASIPIGSIANALNFTPTGTSVAASTATSNTNYRGIWLVKTANGEVVKFRVGQTGCNGNDQTKCDLGAKLDGIGTPSVGKLYSN